MKFFAKAAAFLVTLLVATDGAFAASPLTTLIPDSASVPIIMYHRITPKRSELNTWAITPEEFESDLKFFSDNGFSTVFMSDLVSFVQGTGSLPDKPLVITFDDGDSSVLTRALPLLEKYDMRAVFAVVGSITDEYSTWDPGARKPHLAWDEVNQLISTGRFEVQNHSYALHSSIGPTRRLKGESDERLSARLSGDWLQASGRIKDMTGTVPTTYVYPYGSKSDFTDRLAKRLGFAATLTCADHVNLITRGDSDCLIGLGRTNRPHGKATETVCGKFLNTTRADT
ncbi:MAG: polysaccharide deacetylase family protein [Clostridiales bacterium]|jgi:peptidoglycan/xylan/chitin deacetylase (PgdA/CDA1 family)|nr:polysaccharide deacetylase family protein [Clostridiales bacterium]